LNEDLQILRGNFRTLNLTLIILVGAVLQISLIIGTIWYLFQTNAFQNSSSILIQIIPMIIAYFVLTIIYGVVMSLMIRPKLIVSPFYIQGVTIVFLILMIATTVIVFPSSFQTEEQRESIVANISMFFVFIFVTGLIQELIVRKLVGLTGTREDTEKQTYNVNASFETLARYLTDVAFLKRYFLTVKEYDKDFLVIMSKKQAPTQQVFVLVSDENDHASSILTTICYQIRFDTFFKTNAAREEREIILGTLERRMRREKSDFGFIASNTDNEYSLQQSYYYALRPTEARLASLRDIPTRFVYLTIVLIAIGIGFTIAHVMTAEQTPPLVDQTILAAVWVALIVGIITQLAPAMLDMTGKPKQHQSL
jgi:hypothetical protein